MTNERVFYRKLIEHDHVFADCGEDEIGLMMRESFSSIVCPICKSKTAQYRQFQERVLLPPEPNITYSITEPIISKCVICGWWQSKAECILKCHETINNDKNQVAEWAYSYHPVIEQIDISSNHVMVHDLRNHLLHNWQDKKFISAGKAEELVKSLLIEHLQCDVFCSTANVNEPDGGIDLYVCHENGEVKAAVQVKRRITKEVEPVTEVRNFVGALTIDNIKKGIFVTTAEKFSSVASAIPEKLNTRLELELINGDEILEILRNNTKPHESIIPPYVKSDVFWRDENGNEFDTSQIIFGNE